MTPRQKKTRFNGPHAALCEHYGISRAPAQLLLALVSIPDGQPAPCTVLAQSVGRSHRPECVKPHVTVLRRALANRHALSYTARWGVTLSDAARQEVRAVLGLEPLHEAGG